MQTSLWCGRVPTLASGYDPKHFGKIEAALSRAFDCERRLEAHTNDYGMFNFGDGHTVWDKGRERWSDHYRQWRALHHGAPRVPWLLYIRSGAPKYLLHAVRNTRHVMDIDICHFTTGEFAERAYPEGKIVGALNDYKGLVHWHSGSRLFDYNAMTDYLLYYYYLTGDRRGLDVAKEWGESIKARFVKPQGGVRALLCVRRCWSWPRPPATQNACVWRTFTCST